MVVEIVCRLRNSSWVIKGWWIIVFERTYLLIYLFHLVGINWRHIRLRVYCFVENIWFINGKRTFYHGWQHVVALLLDPLDTRLFQFFNLGLPGAELYSIELVNKRYQRCVEAGNQTIISLCDFRFFVIKVVFQLLFNLFIHSVFI